MLPPCSQAYVAGANPVLVEDGERLLTASRVVVPGVGAFGTAMQALKDMNIVELLVERLERRLPTMTVCLGLQILGHASEESPGGKRSGVVDASATRFAGDIRVPQLGWNYVRAPMMALVICKMVMSTLPTLTAGLRSEAIGAVLAVSTREAL